MASNRVAPSAMTAAPDSWVRAISGLMGIPQSAILINLMMRT